MNDKYDEMAKELLPCSWGCDEHTRSCTAYFRPAVAAALREMGNEIERLKTLVAKHSCNYKIGHPMVKSPCPLCLETPHD